MEISTDPDGTVYVRHHPGGPWLVLNPDGTVSESAMGGAIRWVEDRTPDLSAAAWRAWDEATKAATWRPSFVGTTTPKESA